VQELACIELSLPLVPVADQKQLPQLLGQLYAASFGAAAKKNPFKLGRASSGGAAALSASTHAKVITTLLTIPGLGESKARTLLRNFGSIEAIAKASESDLSLAIGSSGARAVAGFIGKPRK